MCFFKRLKSFFLNLKIQDGRMARKFWRSQVVDPHSFYVDPDPSILSFDADLLSGSDTGIWIQIQVG